MPDYSSRAVLLNHRSTNLCIGRVFCFFLLLRLQWLPLPSQATRCSLESVWIERCAAAVIKEKAARCTQAVQQQVLFFGGEHEREVFVTASLSPLRCLWAEPLTWPIALSEPLKGNFPECHQVWVGHFCKRDNEVFKKGGGGEHIAPVSAVMF